MTSSQAFFLRAPAVAFLAFLAVAPARAVGPTAFDLSKEGNRYVGGRCGDQSPAWNFSFGSPKFKNPPDNADSRKARRGDHHINPVD